MKAPFGTILCATDLTPAGNAAVGVAYALAARGGVVHLVYFDSPPTTGSAFGPPVARAGDAPPPALSDAARQQARVRLQALLPSEASTRGVHTQLESVLADDLPPAIETEAKNRRADVVVLSDHVRWGGLKAAQAEPVAIRLLRRSIPVVMVHAPPP